jgi:branched-chain amino acid transport system substrate-binding protein
MGNHGNGSRRAGARRSARRAVALAAVGALVVGAVACGGDANGGGNGTGAAAGPSGREAERLLGPEHKAAGAPVRIGLVSDGQSQAFDARTEIYAAKATAEWWNERQGGIGGRPIDLVTCETGADPAKGTDCGNQMVEDHVVAVVVGQSTVPETIWEPVHEAGIPTMFFQTNGQDILTDKASSFVLSNPLTTALGLPISVAEDDHAKKAAFVVVDLPVAISLFESIGPTLVKQAGLGYQLVRVPLGTADMTAQMRQVATGGAGVVQVVGNDAFCIAAFQGLRDAGYDGKVTAVSQCVTDATRDALPGDQLKGMYVTSGVALGAKNDPTYRLYQAVMGAYGHDVDVDNNVSMVGYSVLAALGTSLGGIGGDITPATVTRTIKAMPERPLPGGGGVRFRCGGMAMSLAPAVCSNEWLRAALDGHGEPAHYQAVDSTEILQGL